MSCDKTNIDNTSTPIGSSTLTIKTPVLKIAPCANSLLSSTTFSCESVGVVTGGGGGYHNKMLRSPSHESVTTEELVSLLSVSTTAASASELSTQRRNTNAKLLSVNNEHSVSRGQSPNFDSRLYNRRRDDIPEILWFEESNDVIRGVAALSSVIGLSKSFSTTDITTFPQEESGGGCGLNLSNGRNAVSELAISSIPYHRHTTGYFLEQSKLGNASRSCSTWVAVGDMPSTSQLPSPHGGTNLVSVSAATTNNPSSPSFTPADLIRSVNKKVRQHYIRRRLMTTYKALERLSQSEFNLDRLELAASEAAAAAALAKTDRMYKMNGSISAPLGVGQSCNKASKSSSTANPNRLSVAGTSTITIKTNKGCCSGAQNLLTVNDVERERGQPLSKYDRNMMIFNWLLTLDPEEEAQESTLTSDSSLI